MSALQKLQEKIEDWKRDHETLKTENADLRNQLSSAMADSAEKEVISQELEAKVAQCQTHEESISTLQQELREKDEEIEKIIEQVESLLS